MNSFDIQGSYDIVNKQNQKLHEAAKRLQNVADNDDSTAEDMYQEVMSFNQIVQERNLADKVMFVAVKNNFTTEQQVLQELKQ